MEEKKEKPSEKLYAIGAFAKLTGVTERTLRFYDRKGLLKPSRKNEYGHRYYSEQDIFQLQKILVLKYLDFSLEEIEQYLQQHDENFRHTLDSQYELLLRKQKQLEQVISTVEHMKGVLKVSDTLDINLLILLIYSLQNEEKQKEWLAEQLPGSLVNVIFMEGKSKEERIAIEQNIIAQLMELKRLYREGRSPQDGEVREAGQRMITLYSDLLGPILETMSEEELAAVERLEDGQNELDPVLFPNLFTAEEEAFFKEVFEEVDLLGISRKEGNDHGNR